MKNLPLVMQRWLHLTTPRDQAKRYRVLNQLTGLRTLFAARLKRAPKRARRASAARAGGGATADVLAGRLDDDAFDLPRYDYSADRAFLLEYARRSILGDRRPRARRRPRALAKRGARSPVVFKSVSSNKKLSPVTHLAVVGQARPKIVAPKKSRVSSLYLAITATCPATCPFKNNGCYVQAGSVALTKRLDDAATGMSPEEVVRLGVEAVDRAFARGVPQDGARGGRDLRLLESGDVASEAGACMLAGAAQRWLERGGGTVWAYTHWWRDIPREAFGRIKIAASVETVDDADAAYERGYLPALVVPEFKEMNPYALDGSRNALKLIPCPFETKGKTCAECRLCLDRTPRRAAIGFAAHGPKKKNVKEQLVKIDALVRRRRAGTGKRRR